MRNADQLQPGERLGRYVLKKELGRGAMGLVFLAEDTVLHQNICVKMLHPMLTDNAEASSRFTRELVLARRIAHHGVCRMHDLHDEQGLRFLTMEYIDGAPLRELVGKDARPVPVAQALRITRNVCRALAAAHDVGVIHRDLKPRNIMLRSAATATEPDDICLLDFGIATDGLLALTQPGITLGTRHYIAPEMWAGGQATARSDLFAVGVILFNLLVARMPWSAAGGRGFYESMMAAPAPRPSMLRAEISRDVDAVVARALAVDPAKRFSDAHAFARACDNALGALGAAADAPTAAFDTDFPLLEPRARISTAPSVATSSITAPSSNPPTLSLDAFPTLPPSAQLPGWQTTVSPPPFPPPFPSSLPSEPSQPQSTVVVGPRVDDVGDATSASWVVGGRAVDLPARPKEAARKPGSSETELVVRTPQTEMVAKPQRRVGLAVVVGALVGIAAAAAWWIIDDARHADPTTQPPKDAPATDAGTLAEPTADAGAPTADAGTPTADAGIEPAPTDLTPMKAEKRTGTVKAQAQQAQREVDDAARIRGLIAGDDNELDRLRTAGANNLAKKRWAASIDAFNDGIARAGAVRIDKAFMQKKLTRFNARVDKVKAKPMRKQLEAVVTAASADIAAGRLDVANTNINGGFELLEKER